MSKRLASDLLADDRMRYSPIASVFLLSMSLAACRTGIEPSSTEGPGDLGVVKQDLGRTADFGSACGTAISTAICESIPGCVARTCPTCFCDTMQFESCVPSAAGTDGTCPSQPCPPGPPCNPLPCKDLTDGPTCDARPDCYAAYSGTAPCQSSSCANHFVSCNVGPATCVPSGPCVGSCPIDSTCVPGTVRGFPGKPNTCCSDRCVAGSKCAIGT